MGGIEYTAETTATAEGQETYAVPGDYLKVMAVYIYHTTGDKAQRALFPMTIVERDPTRARGTPTDFFVHGESISGDNMMTIGLSPIPDANNAGAELEIWIRQLPKDMVAGGQGPESMLQWQDALVHFAASRAFTRLSTVDPGKAALADRELQQWNVWLSKAKKFQSPIALGFPQRRLITYSPGHDCD
jgi:hypothetical protein